MGRILIKDNSVQITLNLEFYPKDKILKATQDFSDSCWTQIEGDAEKSLLVTLTPKSDKIDLSTLGYEFCNYLLGIIKNLELQSI